jgi:molybdate transport system substrate-binding protein
MFSKNYFDRQKIFYAVRAGAYVEAMAMIVGVDIMIGRFVLALVMLTSTATLSVASDVVLLHAAGSLRAALTEVAAAYQAASGDKVQPKWGASGLLKDEIVAGAKAEVFASANMAHPQALAQAKLSGPVALFARNRLCALVRPGLAVEPATLLDKLLDPQIKVGTSTPRADPSGDYAFEAFKRAEAVKAGAQVILEKKALQLTGAANSAAPPHGRTVYGWHVAEGRADIFLTYCTNAVAAVKENPGQRSIDLPVSLEVGADYGLTVINGSSMGAYRLALFILSVEGQRILAAYGFSAPGLTQ